MEGNCFKLKLNGVVEDSSLPRLNSLVISPKVISTNPASTLYWKLVLVGASSLTVKTADDNGYFATSIANLTDSRLTQTSGTSLTLYFPNVAASYEITPKYDIREFTWEPCTSTGGRPANAHLITNVQCLDTEDFTSIPLTQLVVLAALTGDLKKIKDLPLSSSRQIYLAGCTFTKNATLENLPKTSSQYYIQNTNISGDLDWFAQCLSINTAYLNTHITGTVESFVAAAVGVTGRTRTTLVVANLSNAITFGTYALGQQTLGATSATISWESASKMAVTSTNYAYTKGYTAEEAASAFSGKTVVRIDA